MGISFLNELGVKIRKEYCEYCLFKKGKIGAAEV